jgi:hypothetical protein
MTEKKSVMLKRRYDLEDSAVEVIFYNDGAMAFSRSAAEHFIYLYKDQVRWLKKILEANV